MPPQRRTDWHRTDRAAEKLRVYTEKLRRAAITQGKMRERLAFIIMQNPAAPSAQEINVVAAPPPPEGEDAGVMGAKTAPAAAYPATIAAVAARP